MLISIVVRTLNEEQYLDDLLGRIQTQNLDPRHGVETIVVDSGSSDGTLEIARDRGCRITHISRDEFSFGRSLNRGCEVATGEILVFVSGHCIPTDNDWLAKLIEPLLDSGCSYAYGRQLGAGRTKFSESRVFAKYFPATSHVPQAGFFANNANAALRREVWEHFRFNEALTGLEDMHLAKRLLEAGHQIAYVADAQVHHLHDESWQQIVNRYEREGAALAEIMPESGLSLLDFVMCTVRSIFSDARVALQQGTFRTAAYEICIFRTLQYWGSYRGTRFARMVASMRRKTYFHPNKNFRSQGTRSHDGRRAPSNESSQRSDPAQEFPEARRQTSA